MIPLIVENKAIMVPETEQKGEKSQGVSDDN